jgi:glucose-1-phosphate thymidylyltransferase
MRSIILAGGFGKRLAPFTKQLNKGMAPIYTKEGAIPQILFPLNTLINSGSTDIMIITSRDHCGQLVELLGDGTEYNCNLTYKIQEMDRPVTGIAQALSLAKDFVKDEVAFGVILGDNYYEKSFKAEFDDFYNSCKYYSTEKLEAAPFSKIFVKKVHDPERFGVATMNGNIVTKIIEKPTTPETNLAVTGLYLYTPQVFDILKDLKPSRRSELEITDVNSWYVNNHTMECAVLDNRDCWWHDMGTPEAARETQNFIWSKV